MNIFNLKKLKHSEYPSQNSSIVVLENDTTITGLLPLQELQEIIKPKNIVQVRGTGAWLESSSSSVHIKAYNAFENNTSQNTIVILDERGETVYTNSSIYTTANVTLSSLVDKSFYVDVIEGSVGTLSIDSGVIENIDLTFAMELSSLICFSNTLNLKYLDLTNQRLLMRADLSSDGLNVGYCIFKNHSNYKTYILKNPKNFVIAANYGPDMSGLLALEHNQPKLINYYITEFLGTITDAERTLALSKNINLINTNDL